MSDCYDDRQGVLAIRALEQAGIVRGVGSPPLVDPTAAWAGLTQAGKEMITATHTLICKGFSSSRTDVPPTETVMALWKIAQEAIQNGGIIAPCIVLRHADNTIQLVNREINTDRDKETIDRDILKMVIDDPAVAEIVYISEAWHSNNQQVRPEYDLERTETLVIYDETVEGYTYYFADITGEMPHRQLAPPVSAGQLEFTRFRNYFARARAVKFVRQRQNMNFEAFVAEFVRPDPDQANVGEADATDPVQTDPPETAPEEHHEQA